MSFVVNTHCRACGGELDTVMELGDLYPSRFLDTDESPINGKVPLTLAQCQHCDLVQLHHTVQLDLLYRSYWYKSGLNASMVKALEDVAKSAMLHARLKEDDVVVDIAANDGSLLSYYAPFALTRVGFDPALNIAQEAEVHSDLFINDYFTAAAYPLKQKAKIITSIAMFYDLPDPSAFAEDVRSILHQDGIWIIQLSDLVSMLQHNAFDAICHEHLEYYSLSWLVDFLSTFSLDVFRVEYNDVNGGSLRLYICHAGEREIDPMVETQLRAEKMYLESFPDPMRAFKERVYGFEFMTLHLLHQLRSERKSVYGMAASTKGNTLLQMYGIDSRLIQKIADVNPDKFGRHTIGSNIEIISEQEALLQQPDYFFLLAWHFLPFFQSKHFDYLKSGGKFIVPLPQPKIVYMENGIMCEENIR